MGASPPAQGPCVAQTRYEWFYRSTGGQLLPLPSTTPPFPSDVATTTTIHGVTVPYIVRVESGVINESIYRIAILDDPANPVFDPWSPGGTKPGPGWNGKLFYHFLGGCNPGFRSGRNVATSAINISDTVSTRDEPIRLGFAVALGSRNTLGTGCDDIVSAETAMMVKERFIEQYGVPRHTFGLGSSGGAMQQHMIAYNYPGLLDAITPVRSYPDTLTVVTDVHRLRAVQQVLRHRRLTRPIGPAPKRAKVDGYAVDPQGRNELQRLERVRTRLAGPDQRLRCGCAAGSALQPGDETQAGRVARSRTVSSTRSASIRRLALLASPTTTSACSTACGR